MALTPQDPLTRPDAACPTRSSDRQGNAATQRKHSTRPARSSRIAARRYGSPGADRATRRISDLAPSGLGALGTSGERLTSPAFGGSVQPVGDEAPVPRARS